jgi:NADH:ubiquinone oxidoreductase subunit C
MSNEELKQIIAELLPEAIAEDGGEWININVAAEVLLDAAQQLRASEDLWFDYLFCETCVDWKTHLTMVYHLSSTRYRHNLVMKVKLDREQPRVETLSHIWRTAEFLEREVYEMFGVAFLNHPDLRLLILPDGWEGKNPLRKDFEDPINMIKL